MLDFEPVAMHHRPVVTSLVCQRGYSSGQLTFPSLFALEKYKNLICIDDGVVFIRQGAYDDDRHFGFLLPMAAADEMIVAAFEKIEAYCTAQGVAPRYCDVTNDGASLLKQYYGEKLCFTPKPEAYDYIYERSSLAELSGGKFKAIRQSVTAFSRTYEQRAIYEPITAANSSAVLAFQRDWLKRYAADKAAGLEREDRFISKCFEHWDDLELAGGLIRVDGKVRAYTFGCALNEKVYDILVEKADFGEFPTLYRVINRAFAKKLPGDWQYINRENDMGVAGVRTAKQRYQPICLLKKSLAEAKE